MSLDHFRIEFEEIYRIALHQSGGDDLHDWVYLGVDGDATGTCSFTEHRRIMYHHVLDPYYFMDAYFVDYELHSVVYYYDIRIVQDYDISLGDIYEEYDLYWDSEALRLLYTTEWCTLTP